MATVKIVSQQDWEILKRYLMDNGQLCDNLVLIPDCVAASIPDPDICELRTKPGTACLCGYDFGCEPDVALDVVLDLNHYFLSDFETSEMSEDA